MDSSLNLFSALNQEMTLKISQRSNMKIWIWICQTNECRYHITIFKRHLLLIPQYANILTAGHKISVKSILSACALEASSYHITLWRPNYLWCHKSHLLKTTFLQWVEKCTLSAINVKETLNWRKEKERKHTFAWRKTLHGLVLSLIATAKTADKSNADTLNGPFIGA